MTSVAQTPCDLQVNIMLPGGESATAERYPFPGFDAWLIPGEPQRASSIYQVTGRLYGMNDCYKRVPAKKTITGKNGQTYEANWEVKPTAHFIDLLDQVRALVEMRKYKTFGVITHKAVEPFTREYLGLTDADTMHFYNLRGRNDFKDYEAVFVLGTPSWGSDAVLHAATALFPNRVTPFLGLSEDEKPRLGWAPKMVEYRLSERGLALWQEARGNQYHGAARMVNFYTNPDLDVIHRQTREAELLQAVYRARLITNPADVWLFSPIPLDEIEIDGLFDDAPITPGSMSWETWKKVKAWHDAQPEGTTYDYAALAQGTGVAEKWLRNLKALDAITEFYGDQVERVKEASGHGRRKDVIRKNTQK